MKAQEYQFVAHWKTLFIADSSFVLLTYPDDATGLEYKINFQKRLFDVIY